MVNGRIFRFVLGIFFYPFIFLNDIVASDTVENRELKTIVADGTFIQANPNDPVHYGKGAVTIFKDVRLLGLEAAKIAELINL